MKKQIFALLCMVALMASCTKDYDDDVFDVLSRIPDPVFKEFCVKSLDDNGDGRVSVPEASDLLGLSVFAKGDSYEVGLGLDTQIESLTGVEMFPNIWRMNCDNNNISILDLSRNINLREIKCQNNKLLFLDISQNRALEGLWCGNNDLSRLDVSNNLAISLLDCYDNSLSVLDVRNNSKLQWLHCDINNLSTLDVTNNTLLKGLTCFGNALTSLDISKNMEIMSLNLRDNNFSADAIRDILAALPMREPADQARIYYGGNPGSEEITEADRKVAEDKNWTVIN